MLKKCFIIVFLASMNIFPQPDLSLISISGGVIRNLQSDAYVDDLYSFYPEIEFGGKLADSLSFWSITAGYFDDGISTIKEIKDIDAFYSYKSFSLSVKGTYRLYSFLIKDTPFNLGISGNASLVFLKGHNILKSERLYVVSDKINDKVWELGISIVSDYYFSKCMGLIIEYREIFIMNPENYGYEMMRNLFKVGISLKLDNL